MRTVKFQSLVCLGNGSRQLSMAATIISDLDVPEDIKHELSSIQNQLWDLTDKLRNVKTGE